MMTSSRSGVSRGADDERARLSTEVFGRMALLVHRTSRDAATILDGQGLNPATWQLLLATRAHPGATQRELGQRFGVTGGNVSMLVGKLEAASLLRREARGAANTVWLTPAGLALVERLEPEQTRFMIARFGGLDDAELRELQRLVARAVETSPPRP